jgi:hypothetical protein
MARRIPEASAALIAASALATFALVLRHAQCGIRKMPIALCAALFKNAPADGPVRPQKASMARQHSSRQEEMA